MTEQEALPLAPVVPTVRFEPEEHRYYLEPSGEEIPGVTRALEECGLTDFSMVPRDVLARAQERGTFVHNAIHWYEDGVLDDSSLDEETHGYLMAYLAFKNQMRFTPLMVEKFVHNLERRWAGRVDGVGLIERLDAGVDDTVVDYKSGLVLPAHRLQLAAYVSGLPDPRKYRRMTVGLQSDGRFKVHEYQQDTYLRDLNMFHSAVGVWHWKNEHGPRPRR